MVKLAYLPQYIDLSTNTAKEKFLEIINLILEDNKNVINFEGFLYDREFYCHISGSKTPNFSWRL